MTAGPRVKVPHAAPGQFASPDPLSPRLAAEPLSSNCHVASALAALDEARSRSPRYPYPLASPAAAARPTSRSPSYPYPLASPTAAARPTSRSPRYPYPLASPTAAARPTSRTPRAAAPLAPRLAHNLPQCPVVNLTHHPGAAVYCLVVEIYQVAKNAAERSE